MLFAPMALGLTGFPGGFLAAMRPGVGRPDRLELPIHGDCGSHFARATGTLVACSKGYGRIQMYTALDGFTAGLFAPATDPFSIWVSSEGQVRMFEAGTWHLLPLWVEPRTVPAGPDGGEELPLTWEEVTLRETSRRIEVREQGTGTPLAEIGKRSLLARLPTWEWSVPLALGSWLAFLALRARDPAVPPTA